MARQPFTKSVQTTLDSAGYGSVAVSPASVDWKTTIITVQTSTSALIPVATLYTGSVSLPNILEATYVGSGDSTNTEHVIQAADQIICEWTGGDPGARAVLIIRGWAYPPGQVD
jgi:hypothetical protein